MRVLLLSLFHPELVRGGAQVVAYELFCALRECDKAEPTFLAAIDPSLSSFYKSGAVITGFDGRADEHLFLSRDYDYWWHKLREPIVLTAFTEFLEAVEPQIIHFHHFLLFGIDFITLVRRACPDAAIVFTLHEFLTACHANGQLIRPFDRSICRNPSSARCHQCFPEHRPESFFMREQWFKTHLSEVDLFTTPSSFMIEFFSDWGLDASKIVCVPNGQDIVNAAEQTVSRPRKNRFGFFGQFVDNKGLIVLIDAVKILRSRGIEDYIIEVSGDNLKASSATHQALVDEFFREERDRPFEKQNVILKGPYEIANIGTRMAAVDWCIIPSVWPETFCMVLSEAWAFMKPAIASSVGALRERISPEVDGLLFAPGDASELASVMTRCLNEGGLHQKLVSGITSTNSRKQMATSYLEVYETALRLRHRRVSVEIQAN